MRRHDGWWVAVTVGLFVAMGALITINRLTAAPALKPDAETIYGEFDMAHGDSPTVLLPSPEDNRATIRHWLVFATSDLELQARKFNDGDRVKVTGRSGRGGTWFYIVVASIEAE